MSKLDALIAAVEAPLHREIADLRDLVREASEIMQITYAGNFPAGIESFLVRADRALRAEHGKEQSNG